MYHASIMQSVPLTWMFSRRPVGQQKTRKKWIVPWENSGNMDWNFTMCDFGHCMALPLDSSHDEKKTGKNMFGMGSTNPGGHKDSWNCNHPMIPSRWHRFRDGEQVKCQAFSLHNVWYLAVGSAHVSIWVQWFFQGSLTIWIVQIVANPVGESLQYLKLSAHIGPLSWCTSIYLNLFSSGCPVRSASKTTAGAYCLLGRIGTSQSCRPGGHAQTHSGTEK